MMLSHACHTIILVPFIDVGQLMHPVSLSTPYSISLKPLAHFSNNFLQSSNMFSTCVDKTGSAAISMSHIAIKGRKLLQYCVCAAYMYLKKKKKKHDLK